MIKSIILGLNQKDYGKLSKTIIESFGLSQSLISRKFIEDRRKFERTGDVWKQRFISLWFYGLVDRREIFIKGTNSNSNGNIIDLDHSRLIANRPIRGKEQAIAILNELKKKKQMDKNRFNKARWGNFNNYRR